MRKTFNTFGYIDGNLRIFLFFIPRADLSKKAALDLGVPRESLLIIEVNTLSTQDEAVVLRDYLKKKDMDLIILVISKYHSARAKVIFERALESLDRDIKVISRPAVMISLTRKYG
ncbi:MAG: YdcF family protein [Candidatus Syntrophonatronum acetioxidans]|uniref:YdcF family protein n=1 Tax=Candidatus Syntrophonatronum acetioxidans TaxID=1795816 RepID=A0A424YB76_9FIRM|nr:MAG: YdcF family protein [Candidatus Syntrophonatronum acetioxidans]